MQRWQGAALVAVLCAGCLEPLADDDPGYSRHVLPPGSGVGSAYEDLQINRKIDMNDGASAPGVALKSGFAAGEPVRYWDFGTGKRSGSSAYGLIRCPGGVVPERPELVGGHPMIVDSIPGESDYAPFRALQWACVSEKYKGELITSIDALNDAIELGLITDPTATPAQWWANQPIVAANVGLTFPDTVLPASTAYCKGKALLYHSLEPQEGWFPYAGREVAAGNVYELVKPGQTAASRVIFSQPYWVADADNPDGPKVRNPNYSPSWLVVTVTLKTPSVPAGSPMGTQPPWDALLESLNDESQLVTVGMNNSLTVKDAAIVQSAMVTTNRVNRPFMINEVKP